VIPIPIEPLLTPAPLENQEQQAAAPEPQEPQENPEPTATAPEPQLIPRQQENQAAAPEPQLIPRQQENQEQQAAAPEPQEEVEIVQVEEPVVQVEELTQQSFFNSPPLIQSHSTNHLNSTQIPHSNEPRRMLQVSAIQSPQSPVHIVGEDIMEPVEVNEVESSDDDIIFVEEVAAPTRPERRRRRSGIQLRPRIIIQDEEEYFVEKVVGWMMERGRELFLIKWAGYSDEHNTWEDGVEKRREIPEMVADYFTESGFDDELSRFDDLNDHTYVNRRSKRRRLL
jgi:hypothetical protein